MELDAEIIYLTELFRERAAAKRLERLLDEEADRQRDERKQTTARKEREDREEKAAEAVVLATAQQIDAFRGELDEYDTATVHALIDNQHLLDELRQRREAIEAAAFRLPDGRMVFKSQDGQRVYDRKGVELGPDVIRPEAIPDAKPRREEMKANDDAELSASVSQHDLQSFDERVHRLREAIDKGGLTTDAIARMRQDLQSTAPDAVKSHLQATGPMAVAAIEPPVIPPADQLRALAMQPPVRFDAAPRP